MGGDCLDDLTKFKHKSLDAIPLSRAHAKHLMEPRQQSDGAGGADLETDSLLETDVLPQLVPAGDDYDTWARALSSYRKCVRFLRYTPTDDEVVMGEEGWREQIGAHAEEFQRAADEFTNCIIRVCGGDKVITNYIHLLRAGHLKEMMELHGYLAYLANDAVEKINDIVSTIYHRHSQQGGAQGQDAEHGGKQGSHTDGIERYALAHIAYATEDAEKAIAERKAGAAERRKRPHLREVYGSRAGCPNRPSKAARRLEKLPSLDS